MRTVIVGCMLLAVQQPAAYDAKAGLTLMRAINTAENAERAASGQYLPLERLVTSKMMARVSQAVTFNGDDATYMGQIVRVLVSADGQRYQVQLVPPSGCGVSFFTDERGLIFEGKVIGCP
jgi:hypothetical protein